MWIKIPRIGVAKEIMKLHRPIGIFDAGIGSYAIVERVRAAFPAQDVLYFADRASFPYGAKSPQQLLEVVQRATAFLQDQGCVAVVLASNAPSVVVLEPLRAAAAVPVIGIFPPVAEAVRRSASGKVAVLGVRSMVDSAAMQAYAAAHRGAGEVLLANASALVELVENFDFVHRPQATQATVDDFIAGLRAAHPLVDVMTMSSTHLPWLKPFFEAAAPDVQFLDPADSVLAELAPHTSAGAGLTRCLATASAELSLEDFNTALRALGTPLQAELAAVA
ncbi:Asp/Glu racemase [Duganella sp. BJB488]|nr:Asp/Glu racemase [Duganella sp. BJB488]